MRTEQIEVKTQGLMGTIPGCLGIDGPELSKNVENVLLDQPIPYLCFSDHLGLARQRIESETLSLEDRYRAQFSNSCTLINEHTTFPAGADLLISAFCTPLVYKRFQKDFATRRKMVYICPQIDDIVEVRDILAAILRRSKVKSLTVTHLEASPCVHLAIIARQALDVSGLNIELTEVTIGVTGRVLRANNIRKYRTSDKIRGGEALFTTY